MPDPLDRIQLGKTSLQLSTIGTGAWSWGDRMFWGYGQSYRENDVQTAFDATLVSGINCLDTAEVYGQGRSEELIGQFISACPERPLIASKFMPYPWRLSRTALLRAARASLKRLGLTSIDLYQIHWPLPPLPVETWADALGDAVEQGLVRAVGVSNFNEEQMRRAYLTLAKRSIPLASNQVEYHLLQRRIEHNGLLQAAKEMGVTIIAYSPLAQGLLTGKYTPQYPPQGVRGRRTSRKLLQQLGPLLRDLAEVGAAHNENSCPCTPAQVALNWLICKGTLPIPGAKYAAQAVENAGAMGWRLTAAEIERLEKSASRVVS
jgi:aryl-alcohol dehydrogenase-like predicted oxidoreductase